MGEFSPLVQVQALHKAISEYRVEGIIVQPRLGQSITSTLETAERFCRAGHLQLVRGDEEPRLPRKGAGEVGRADGALLTFPSS